MKYTFCGMELIIHPRDKRPKYDVMRHFKDVIDERLDEIKRQLT